MQIITSNNLNTSTPFSIAYREHEGEIFVRNGDTPLALTGIFGRLKSMYPKRFRGGIVYSELTLRDNIRETKRIMSKYFGEKYHLVWAMKSAPVQRIVEIAAEEGSGFDVGSFEEMTLALRYTSGQNVYHTSPGKFDWDIETIVSRHCVSITDNIQELQELNAKAASLNVVADVGIRINPSVDSKTQREVSTGGIDCKFGLPEITLPDFEEMKRLGNLNIRILHMHIGTQVSDTNDYLQAMKSIVSMYHAFKRHGFPIDTIDIGGGFPFPYSRQEESTGHAAHEHTGHAFLNHAQYGFEEYIAAIAAAFRASLNDQDLPIISIEPGRHITAGTAFAVGYILNRKLYPNGIQWLISSISVNDLYFKTLVPDTYFDFHLITQEPPQGHIPTAIGGTLCFSGDILSPTGKAVNLPVNVSRNDIILYTGVGAYSLLGSGNFHNMPRLPIVMIDAKSDIVELRPQETPYFE